MGEAKQSREANYSNTVLKALDVLDCLTASKRPMSTLEIAKSCNMSRPTVYRLLTTLQSRDYVNCRDRTYTLGTKILSLSRVLLESMDLAGRSQPFLRRLSRISGETSYLAILDGTEILYINKVESTQSVRSNCTIGTRNPLYSTSMGKAILAFLPLEERDSLLERITFSKFTENTITEKSRLVSELAEIRRRGYAIDNLEMEDNVRCVGAPVFDHMDYPFAAISFSGPAFRLSIERIRELSACVIDITQSLSSQLGHTKSARLLESR